MALGHVAVDVGVEARPVVPLAEQGCGARGRWVAHAIMVGGEDGASEGGGDVGDGPIGSVNPNATVYDVIVADEGAAGEVPIDARANLLG